MFETTSQPWYFHDIPILCLQLPKTFDDSSLDIFLSAGKIAVFFLLVEFWFLLVKPLFCWYWYSRYFPLYPDISHYIKIFPMFPRYFHHIQISITMNSLWQSNMAMEKTHHFGYVGSVKASRKWDVFHFPCCARERSCKSVSKVLSNNVLAWSSGYGSKVIPRICMIKKLRSMVLSGL